MVLNKKPTTKDKEWDWPLFKVKCSLILFADFSGLQYPVIALGIHQLRHPANKPGSVLKTLFA